MKFVEILESIFTITRLDRKDSESDHSSNRCSATSVMNLKSLDEANAVRISHQSNGIEGKTYMVTELQQELVEPMSSDSIKITLLRRSVKESINDETRSQV